MTQVQAVRPGATQTSKPEPVRKSGRADMGRNDPCWCGSGKKYKNCHMRQDQKLSYAGRASSASPAVGYLQLHAEHQKALVDAAHRHAAGAPQSDDITVIALACEPESAAEAA